MMQVENIRQEFPALAESVYGKPLVYLDNAATSERPRSVIRKWTEMSEKYNANLHRAVHRTAALATAEYEATRDAVRAYLNAEFREEIIFTSGTTASINLVAFSFGEAFVHAGDEILVCEVRSYLYRPPRALSIPPPASASTHSYPPAPHHRYLVHYYPKAAPSYLTHTARQSRLPPGPRPPSNRHRNKGNTRARRFYCALRQSPYRPRSQHLGPAAPLLR